MTGSVTNRVWDIVKTGSVSWITDFPDGTGFEYPGPGAWSGSTSDFCVVRGTASVDEPADLLSSRFSPVLLTRLDGDLTSSASANFILDTGTEQYTTGPVAGTQGHFFNGSTILVHSAHNSELLITGNMTMEALAWYSSSALTDGFKDIMGFHGALDAENTNAIWQMGVNNGSPFYSHEYDAGVNQTFTWTGTSVPVNEWFHMAMVREQATKKVRLYLNGELASVEYTYDSDPTGGTIAKAAIGGFWAANLNMWEGRISSVKLIGRILTHAEIMAEYKTWLDPSDR